MRAETALVARVVQPYPNHYISRPIRGSATAKPPAVEKRQFTLEKQPAHSIYRTEAERLSHKLGRSGILSSFSLELRCQDKVPDVYPQQLHRRLWLTEPGQAKPVSRVRHTGKISGPPLRSSTGDTLCENSWFIWQRRKISERRTSTP